MRWRVIAFISIGINLLLAALWLGRSSTVSGRTAAAGSAASQAIGTPGRTNFILRRQFFSWREVESPDYPTYIANLRDIGCPEQTIRDIIIADVNALYARRRANEVVTPEQQWWRTEPDIALAQLAAEKTRALEDERRALLSRLLGTNWESGDMVTLPRPSRQGVVLDGPVLGALASDVKQALQELNLRSQDRLQAYLDGQREKGKPADPIEIAKLRQQTRDDLARVLSPAQLEEYLLRYSQNANNLRTEFGQLQFFNPSPDEFRAVFRGIDGVEQQLQLLGDGTDPNALQARRALEAQLDNAIKTALGSKRYAEYQLLHDPLYQDAVAQAQAAGTPESAATLYQINLAAASTQDAVQANTNLTAEQRAIELKQLELDQLKANTLATGHDLAPEPQQAPPRRTYTLQAGDTPAVVGMIYGVPETAIRAANPGLDFSRLRAGDSITIPRNALGPTPVARTPYGP